MEESARRFARTVLLVHLLLLAGVVALVCFAAKGVYSGARQQAIEQATRRQSLLADQTSRGIESYYNSIVDNFDLARRNDEEDASATQPATQSATEFTAPEPRRPEIARGENPRGEPPRNEGPRGEAPRGEPPRGDQPRGENPRFQRRPGDLARRMFEPALWQQLRNRASHFIIVDRSEQMRTLFTLPEQQSEVGQKITEQAAEWLKSVKAPAISKVVKIDNEPVNLVCVPTPDNRRLFVAVVPLKNIEEQFLSAVNANKLMSAMLLDENVRVMAAFNNNLVGLSMTDDASDPNVRKLAEHYLKLGAAGTEVIEQGFNLGDHRFDGGIVSVQPIEVRGRRWWLAIGSSFAEVDSVVRSTFRGALQWAIFVVISVTAILVSTAVQMIRSRSRLERTRRELLERELSQARQIQLAWLPKKQGDLPNVDLAAVNKPASHISGDFYNWFELEDGRVCVVIGDVTGHGMAAAFLMATTQLLVRMIMPRMLDPGRCLEEVNRQLCQQVFNGQFVTMEVLLIDRPNGRLEIAAAGHPPPLISDGNSFKPLPIETHLVLGVERDVDYPSESFDLPESASLLLYTDGVVEAYNGDGKQFGNGGLKQCLHGRFDDARAICTCVIDAVDAFRGPAELRDDLTLVTIQLAAVSEATPSLTAAT